MRAQLLRFNKENRINDISEFKEDEYAHMYEDYIE